jgi:hypothetical protein
VIIIIIIIVIVENVSVSCARLSTALIGNTPIKDYDLYNHMLKEETIVSQHCKGRKHTEFYGVYKGVISDEFHKCCSSVWN